MSAHKSEQARAAYFKAAETWSQDVERNRERQARLAWTIASAASFIAVLEAIALVALTPLKKVEPYTLLVDRQTGYVEALKPLERDTITPDAALVRSFLAQYVIAREGFDIDTLKTDYRKVALWSAGEARERYTASMQVSNAQSPLATLPRRAQVQVQIRSISSLNADTALVRFTTTRADLSAKASTAQNWVAVLNFRFSGAEMSADDRLLNPIGFQVVRYRRDAENIPEPREIPTPPEDNPPLPPDQVDVSIIGEIE